MYIYIYVKVMERKLKFLKQIFLLILSSYLSTILFKKKTPIFTNLAFYFKRNRGKFIYVLKQQEEEGKNNKKNNAKRLCDLYCGVCIFLKQAKNKNFLLTNLHSCIRLSFFYAIYLFISPFNIQCSNRDGELKEKKNKICFPEIKM